MAGLGSRTGAESTESGRVAWHELRYCENLGKPTKTLVVVVAAVTLATVIAIIVQPSPGPARSQLEQGWLHGSAVSILDARVKPAFLSIQDVDRIVSQESRLGRDRVRAQRRGDDRAAGAFATIVVGYDRSSLRLAVAAKLHSTGETLIYTKDPGDWQPPIYDRMKVSDWASAIEQLHSASDAFDLIRGGPR